MTDDDLARAASDAIGAFCAAHPAPPWTALPAGVLPEGFTEVWCGVVEHEPVGGETRARFAWRTEPFEITYAVHEQGEAVIDDLRARIVGVLEECRVLIPEYQADAVMAVVRPELEARRDAEILEYLRSHPDETAAFIRREQQRLIVRSTGALFI